MAGWLGCMCSFALGPIGDRLSYSFESPVVWNWVIRTTILPHDIGTIHSQMRFGYY